MTEMYKAVLDADSELWGVEGEDGAILYEADMANEAQARFFAKYHTDHPDAEFERDVWPAWCEHLAATDPYESALLFVETAPQEDLINLIIEHRKLKNIVEAGRKFMAEKVEPVRLLAMDISMKYEPCGYYCDPGEDGGGHHDHKLFNWAKYLFGSGEEDYLPVELDPFPERRVDRERTGRF